MHKNNWTEKRLDEDRPNTCGAFTITQLHLTRRERTSVIVLKLYKAFLIFVSTLKQSREKHACIKQLS